MMEHLDHIIGAAKISGVYRPPGGEEGAHEQEARRIMGIAD